MAGKEVRRWLSITREMLSSPGTFFTREHHIAGVYYGMASLLLLSLFSGLFYGGFMAWATVSSPTPAFYFNSSLATSVLAVLGAFMSASLIVLFLAIPALVALGVTHLLVIFLGGESILETLDAAGYSTGVLAVAGWIPFLNLIAMAYWNVLFFLGIRQRHRLGNVKSAAAVLPSAAMMAAFIYLTIQSNKVIGMVL